MMRPIKQLPSNYYEYATLDLSKNKRAAILLNLAGIPLLIGTGWLFIRLALRLNPTIWRDFDLYRLISISNLLWFIVILIGTIILHELVHGLFIGVYTRERPIYGYSWAYAYAGAPAWYLPRRVYLVIALAPLLVISFIGLILLPFTTIVDAIVLLIILITNASGAIGDLYVTFWVLWQPPNILVRDTGPAFTLYRQGDNEQT